MHRKAMRLVIVTGGGGGGGAPIDFVGGGVHRRSLASTGVYWRLPTFTGVRRRDGQEQGM